MSDQSDALNKLARERGIISDSPAESPYVLAPRGGKVEYQFDQVIEAARRINAFEWHLPPGPAQGETGKAGLTPANKSWFGKLLGNRYGGTRFTLADAGRCASASVAAIASGIT